jgi:hypothetical protein
MATGAEKKSSNMGSTASGSTSGLKTLWILKTRFEGLEYKTKRIQSISKRGKYL